jgi:hypothetical protein
MSPCDLHAQTDLAGPSPNMHMMEFGAVKEQRS